MAQTGRRRVLLIGWDAADWEHITPLLEEGLLPTLEKLINRGVMGNLATLQPILSPMLWNSIATGKHAYKHGIHGFIEPDPHNGGARPYTSYSRKTRALWNIFHNQGIRTNVINWWASHPAEPINGCIVTNAFGGAKFDPHRRGFAVARGTIHPADKSDLYARFKVPPAELTKEHLLPFIPDGAKVNQDEDQRVLSLAKVLSETVTTHAVATAVMQQEPWDFMAVYYTGIDHFSHGFMVYHPPKLPWVKQEDFDIFKDVVKGAYRFHDMMLERLLYLAGPDTTVVLCSDHGFQSRDLRPRGMPREPAGPAIWHRRYGIFVAAGPGIKKDERVYGASLTDVTPTILTMYGLPVGEDMDGRALTEIFEQPPRVERIPSWDALEGDFGMHQSETAVSPDEAQELMQQFAALGYIDDPGKNKEEAAESAELEAKYNLARNYQWLQMEEEAIPLLEELVRRRNWEARYISQLAIAYQMAGYLEASLKLINSAFDVHQTRATPVLLTWALCKIGLGLVNDGVAMLVKLEKSQRRLPPGMLHRIGDTYRKLRRWDDAERIYRKAVEEHAETAEGHLGLSSIALRRGRNQEAADEALKAIGLIYRLPQAHINLGVALLRGGDAARAELAFQTALRFGPRMARAHRWLAFLYRTLLRDPEKARHHRAEYRRLGGRKEYGLPVGSRPYTEVDLGPMLTEEQREERLNKERPPQVDPRKRTGKTFILVSGLPRSGTSLMMQMLEAGGLPPKTDGEREADVDNPKGYYEWEDIKKVGRYPTILDEEGLQGKAIKCVSMLLQQMPYGHEYKVIFMTRPVEEVVASQADMIERLKTEGANMDRQQIERGLEQHRQQILAWMKQHKRLTFVEVDYPALIKNPDEAIRRVAELLGPDLLPHPERMRSVIDASLYRKRAKQAPSAG